MPASMRGSSRIEHYEALGEELDRRFRQRTLADWSTRLSANDVPFAPINGIDAVVEDPQARHLGLIVPVESASEGGRHAVRPALQFDGTRADSVSAAPLLNEHGDAIRAALARDGGWPAPAGGMTGPGGPRDDRGAAHDPDAFPDHRWSAACRSPSG